MRWRWIVLIAALVLLVAVPVVAVYRVLNSQAGLELALAQLQRLESIRIEANCQELQRSGVCKSRKKKAPISSG